MKTEECLAEAEALALYFEGKGIDIGDATTVMCMMLGNILAQTDNPILGICVQDMIQASLEMHTKMLADEEDDEEGGEENGEEETGGTLN